MTPHSTRLVAALRTAVPPRSEMTPPVPGRRGNNNDD